MNFAVPFDLYVFSTASENDSRVFLTRKKSWSVPLIELSTKIKCATTTFKLQNKLAAIPKKTEMRNENNKMCSQEKKKKQEQCSKLTIT